MTDEDSSIYDLTKHLDIVAVVALFIASSIVFIIFLNTLFSGGGAIYQVTCEEYDGVLRDEWITSDNITSYKDIPQSQRMTLSNESIDRLKELPPRLYNATEYTEMSEERRSVFRRALNETVEVDTRKEASYSKVIYRQDVYECDLGRYSGA